MFPEQSLHDQPALVKALMGVDAAQFWTLIQPMTDQFAAYSHQQRQRPDRQRRSGAGRKPDLPLAIRTALVLTYLRLPIPQATVAKLFGGATQADVSRDLRRVLPLIQQCLPCPVVWEEVADEPPQAIAHPLSLSDLTDGRVLIDATEQPVARPRNAMQQKAYYSGKKHDHTLKTQVVTDGEHHICAISVAVPGARQDQALSDDRHTLAHWPDGGEADADKGYQGLAAAVPLVRVRDAHTGAEQVVPRGGTNAVQETQRRATERRAEGLQSGAGGGARAGGALPWLGQELGDLSDALSRCPHHLHRDHGYDLWFCECANRPLASRQSEG